MDGNNPRHFLYPGALFISYDPYSITTILGSCVALCLYDPILKIGGMNHFMLPLWNGQGLASPRYGNIAITKLLENIEALGSSKKNLKAKIFGGADIISAETSHFMIGERNITLAKDMLKEHNIPIIASSVGGRRGRKIIYDTYTGEVRQKYVGNE